MVTHNVEQAKKVLTQEKRAKSNTSICMYPNCNEEAIDSHIMQKNGILSSISENNHLWELKVNHFNSDLLEFKKTGINRIYTFKGFCNKHDSLVFSKIENQKTLDFNDYETCLLFALRTACNELRLKEWLMKSREKLMNETDDEEEKEFYSAQKEGQWLGVKDFKPVINTMWSDIQNKKESFVFKHRELDLTELCLNSIYTYETTYDLFKYYSKHGKPMEGVSDIFISFFPYKTKSILLMGYLKDDAPKLKSFINPFFNEKIRRLNRKLSSLIIFNCETWVCSESFYKEKLEGLDKEFAKSLKYSSKTYNERKTYDVDLFKPDFKKRFKDFANDILK